MMTSEAVPMRLYTPIGYHRRVIVFADEVRTAAEVTGLSDDVRGSAVSA